MLALALVVLVAHGLYFGDWIVDDAGISFSYARNLAQGFGLVSQPGVAPVEGFSNPLWTLLLVPFFLSGTFFVPWTAKLLSFALIGATFWLIARAAADRGVAAWLGVSPVVFLALNTSFVVWATSGLENPLLAFLIALSVTLAVGAAEGKSGGLDAAAGLVGSLLALTRPEGVVYAAAYPLVVGLARWSEGRPRLVRRAAAYGLPFGLAFGAYLLFRRVYFGDWVPNTFHAKVRPFLLELGPARLVEVVESATGRLSLLVVVILIAAAAQALRTRRSDPRALALLPYLALSGAAYLLLPPDWMGEYRFATAFLVVFYWLLGLAFSSLFEGLARAGSPARWLPLAAALLLLCESTSINAERSAAFAENPTVPFARISEFAEAYDRVSEDLGPGPHSLLAPDLGGTLFRGRLRVFDLAGLCDRTIARTLMGNRAGFHDYVFVTARPTFIHVHGSWAEWAALRSDPRFDRDYTAIFEEWQRPRGAEPSREGEPWSGDYVRRDAVPRREVLEGVRRSFVVGGLRRTLP